MEVNDKKFKTQLPAARMMPYVPSKNFIGE